jgi:hypothetical protein
MPSNNLLVFGHFRSSVVCISRTQWRHQDDTYLFQTIQFLCAQGVDK